MKQLSSPLQQYWPTVVERLPAAISESSLSVQAKSVLTFSDFVRDSIIAHPEWLSELESTPPLADEWQHYANWLQQALADVSDENTLMRELRLFRRRIMVRIAWAQTLSLVTEESILQQLSHLAETLIVAARDFAATFMISAERGHGVADLKRWLAGEVPPGPSVPFL